MSPRVTRFSGQLQAHMKLLTTTLLRGGSVVLHQTQEAHVKRGN